MDEIDRKIIAHMQRDARASYAEVGAAVGLSVSAVNERLKKLQAAGTIRGWRADLDPDAVGFGLLAFVLVLLDRPEHEAGFRAAMVDTPAVLECHHVTGEWSYLLKVRASGTAALEEVLARRIKSAPGVSRTLTTIALSSIKETAALPVG